VDELRTNSHESNVGPSGRSDRKRSERLKRDDETWDEFLRRITATEEPVEAGAWSDEEADRAKDAIRDARENWR
jgi:hypothetical protein